MRKIPETITEEELIKICEAIKKNYPEHKLAFMLGFYEAMRVGEVAKLQPENINKERRLIYLKQAKGSKDRNIPIAPEVMKGLRHLPIGIKVRALQFAFKKIALKVLNKDLHFHTLRHSGITHYLNVKKWDIRQLQVFAGHSRITTTEIYTHVSPSNLVDKMWEGEK